MSFPDFVMFSIFIRIGIYIHIEIENKNVWIAQEKQ